MRCYEHRSHPLHHTEKLENKLCLLNRRKCEKAVSSVGRREIKEAYMINHQNPFSLREFEPPA
jgi:hypothetical protein